MSRLDEFRKLSDIFPSLIPVVGKRPIEKGWTRWCAESRPFDENEFKECNAGIPCGPANGSLAIDVDDLEKFDKMRKAKEREIPVTRQHLTGTGNLHIILAYPKDGKRYGNRSFKKFGFDIRGDGGQIVAPGSIHPDTGKPYKVLKDIPIAEAPQWLLDLALQEPEPTETNHVAIDLVESLPVSFAIKNLIRNSVPEGQRSEAIASVLSALIRTKASDDTIFHIFNTYPIGEKYWEKGNSKGKWLQDEIDRAKGFQDEGTYAIGNIIMTIDQFCKLEQPARMEYISPWIKEGSIGLISGWRGTGKTWFAFGILDAVSSGKSFGPWKCKMSVPCLLLDGEMPTQDIVERSNALGITSDRENPFYIYSDAYANRKGLPRAHLANESWRKKMKETLLTLGVKLWVVDNLASLANGLDENKKQDWDPINSWLLELRFAGISTIMLHHVNKSGGQRGTSAREDNLDVSIMLKSPFNYNPEDGARFITHFSKARVQTSRLNLISDTEFKLVLDESGNHAWTYSGVRQENRKEILRLLGDGMSQIEVAGALGIDKGYVSRTRKKAIEDDLLTKKNKLTQLGVWDVAE